MHSSNLVIIENIVRCSGIKDPRLIATVKEAMGPHEDEGGFWDWYQIGGRWTGILSDYDPMKDPLNWKSCELCNGSGFRTDPVGEHCRFDNPTYTCNGCGEFEKGTWTHAPQGPGIKVVWSTDFTPYDGDVALIETLTDKIYPDRFFRVIAKGNIWGGDVYYPWRKEDNFLELEKPPLEWLKTEYAKHLVVVVDSHS